MQYNSDPHNHCSIEIDFEKPDRSLFAETALSELQDAAARRSLASELFAQLVLRAHQDPALRRRKIAASAIDVEGQHGNC